MPVARKTEQILSQILRLAESVAKPMALEVVDVKFGQQGRRRSLEVTIFRPNGFVSLSDCEQVSRQLETLIEQNIDDDGSPLLESAFVLEVQSPGIDRQLKTEREFHIFAGRQVKVQMKDRLDDLGTVFTGALSGCESGKLLIGKPKPYTSETKGVGSAKNKRAVHKQKNNQGVITDIAHTTQPQTVVVDLKNVLQIRLLSSLNENLNNHTIE